MLAHVTFWSDLSVPIFDFNIYLTGYDVQTINLRDILVNGILPQTASDGQDPTDTISPQGPFSQDINFSSCSVILPPPAALPAIFIQHLQTSLTGKPSPILGNLCAGRTLGDNIARGYITVDTVNNCTLRFPSDTGYFGGDATDQNVLWGDYFYINRLRTRPRAIRWSTSWPTPPIPTPRPPATTLSMAATSAGRRRTTAIRWPPTSPPATSGDNSTDTSLVVWRDSKVSQTPFTCPATANVRPSWFPLGQEGLVIFDETEQAQVPQSSPVSPAPPSSLSPFPAESQRVAVGGGRLPVPFAAGWLYLNLNTTVTPAGAVPPSDPAAAQAWVSVKMGNSAGRFSVGFDAIQLDNASHPNHTSPGQ